MDEILHRRARKMRRNPSAAEFSLWQTLRSRRFKKYKFRRQYIIEPYIVDFVCLKMKLIIELDGEQHEETIKYDLKRTYYLEKNGYKVIRFRNTEYFTFEERVLDRILFELQNRF